MTKKEMFNLIATINADNTEIVEFCNREIELLEKRSSTKTPTKTQKENEVLMGVIEEALSALGDKTTVTNLIVSSEALANLSNQKVSALLRKMVDTGKVIKTTEGKKTLFSLA